MRIAVLLLLLVHGLIHLLGFVSAFGLAEVPQLHGISRSLGALWLVAAVLLVVAAVLVLARASAWWMVAAPALLLSQVLIVTAWSDAKAGTVANLLLAVAVVLAWSDWRFQRESDAAVRALFARVPAAPGAIVTREEVARLPAPVARWLEGAGVVGKPRVRVARLRQRGLMRTSPDQAYMPAEAEQYFAVDPPGFVWRVRVRMAKVLPVVGRDAYLDGRGRMLITVGGLVTVVDATGPEIDQGTMLRFLGEIVWFPSAALAPSITWEAIDERSARATMTHRGVSASAVFTFDADGRQVQLDAQRYMDDGKGHPTLQPWIVPARAWREVRGVRIPVEGDVTWRLPAGDFTYYRWEILDVESDVAELYSRR